MLDNEPQFTMLSFEGVSYALTADQQAFIDTYKTQGTVYQTAVNYANPQWMDVGKDLTALVTDAMTPEEVLASIDQRRTDMAVAAEDSAWEIVTKSNSIAKSFLLKFQLTIKKCCEPD
ncbi:MAG: hypothetical protein AB9891_12340 [Anaerolineaceae bacterium]